MKLRAFVWAVANKRKSPLPPREFHKNWVMAAGEGKGEGEPMNLTLKHYSGKMRRNSSRAEAYLWKLLRGRKLNGYKFRRQYVIEPYIVDYICLYKKLIIELDGNSHDFQQAYDARRTTYLNTLGYRVIRFTNTTLLSHPEDVLTAILQALEESMQ